MANFEIEIKSLIGDRTKADELIGKMKQLDSALRVHGSHKQLNHYFVEGDLGKLKNKLHGHLPSDKSQEFDQFVSAAKDYSVRTRWADGKVIFVMKATVDDTTSANGTARREFESEVNLTLEQLDQILLDCGFKYQAKWSREREDYSYKNLNVTVDKNAGYGYLAEFESVLTDESQAESAKAQIREVMKELGVEELAQDRLQRMFDHYNQNWQEYYGTDKVFNIE
jgi:predicted adenylyl cyclase CyaB